MNSSNSNNEINDNCSNSVSTSSTSSTSISKTFFEKFSWTPLVLRVSQIDAMRLDIELAQLMRAQFMKVFDFFKPSLAKKFEPELEAIVHLLIYRLSMYSKDATYGQRLLNLKYAYENKATTNHQLLNIDTNKVKVPVLSALTRSQKLQYGIASIGGRWLWTRINDICSYWEWSAREESDPLKKLWRLKELLEKIYRVLSLLNTLVFLRTGKFPTVLDRVLKVRQVYANENSSRQVSFEFMNRQLLWHGFAEFLLFILPLINVQRIKNLALRMVFFTTSLQVGRQDNDKQKKKGKKRNEKNNSNKNGQKVNGNGRLAHNSSSDDIDDDIDEYNEDDDDDDDDDDDNEVEDDLKLPCGICGESPIGTPTIIPCGHIYCYFCISANCIADSDYHCPRCGKNTEGKYERWQPRQE